MLQPIPTRIYRITHLDNLLATLQHGIFCRNQPMPATTAYRNIGDASLTDRRNRIAVPLPPGGFLNDYVPFYLGPRSPMLYTNFMYLDYTWSEVGLAIGSVSVLAVRHHLSMLDAHPYGRSILNYCIYSGHLKQHWNCIPKLIFYGKK